MLRLPLFTGLVWLVLTVDAIEAYGLSFGLEDLGLLLPGGGASEASKKGDSTGCTAGGVAKSMFFMRERLAGSAAEDSSAGFPSSARGEETAGVCLLDAAVDASLPCLTGKRPLAPTVTCFGFAKEELEPLFTDGVGESPPLPCPGIITCSIFTLPSSGVPDPVSESGVSDERPDFTETIRAAPEEAVWAGIG